MSRYIEGKKIGVCFVNSEFRLYTDFFFEFTKMYTLHFYLF